MQKQHQLKRKANCEHLSFNMTTSSWLLHYHDIFRNHQCHNDPVSCNGLDTIETEVWQPSKFPISGKNWSIQILLSILAQQRKQFAKENPLNIHHHHLRIAFGRIGQMFQISDNPGPLHFLELSKHVLSWYISEIQFGAKLAIGPPPFSLVGSRPS